MANTIQYTPSSFLNTFILKIVNKYNNKNHHMNWWEFSWKSELGLDLIWYYLDLMGQL